MRDPYSLCQVSSADINSKGPSGHPRDWAYKQRTPLHSGNRGTPTATKYLCLAYSIVVRVAEGSWVFSRRRHSLPPPSRPLRQFNVQRSDAFPKPLGLVCTWSKGSRMCVELMRGGPHRATGGSSSSSTVPVGLGFVEQTAVAEKDEGSRRVIGVEKIRVIEADKILSFLSSALSCGTDITGFVIHDRGGDRGSRSTLFVDLKLFQSQELHGNHSLKNGEQYFQAENRRDKEKRGEFHTK
ncbi:hypothetical protein K438DRAFT_1768090 [Mycena galopus ATCC 62051]|nr:hypothetical protein K438DRAFT_1768090 [Mycena galopus ATCC 62051]